jgi:hypothetical protein
VVGEEEERILTGITSFPIPSAGIIPNLRVVRLIAAAIFVYYVYVKYKCSEQNDTWVTEIRNSSRLFGRPHSSIPPCLLGLLGESKCSKDHTMGKLGCSAEIHDAYMMLSKSRNLQQLSSFHPLSLFLAKPLLPSRTPFPLPSRTTAS